MTKATAKSKNKKPLQTTLGKAPVCISDEVDLSHVQKPIDTSIFGLREVLTLFKTATEEVQNYVTYECDIMYECRICRTIFRSLANFVLHKRKYCRELYGRKKYAFSNESLGDTTIYIVSDEEEKGVQAKEQSVNGEKVHDLLPNDVKDTDNDDVKIKNKRSLCTILPRLIDKQESALITEECLKDTSGETKPFTTEVKNNIILQSICDSKSGVFQTRLESNDQEFDYMRTEVMEIHNVLENNEAVIGNDGKIVRSDYAKDSVLKNNLTCTKCDEIFSTKKTLRCHVKYRHNSSRQLYKCTDCSDTFANTWGVFRHLYKAHRKTPAQVKKLRSQICNNLISRSEHLDIKNNEEFGDKVIGVQEKLDLENKQWLNDLEGDNDLQICGGCGRKFERKAALNSHSHFCTKRIALCNSIKENTVKRLQEEKGKIPKITKVSELEEKNMTDGLRRRKPLVAHKILRFDYYKDDIPKIEEFKQQDSNTAINLKSSVELIQENVQTVTEEAAINKDCESATKAESVENVQAQTNLPKVVEEKTDLDPCETVVTKTDVLSITEECGNKRKSKDSDKSTTGAKRKCKDWHALHSKSINYVDREKNTCLPCSKVFKCNKALMRHMAGHFNWSRYQCNACEYRSYQKSKCENHVEKVHEIRDKDALNSYVLRMSHKRTVELSTDFICYVKKCNNGTTEYKQSENMDSIKIAEETSGVNEDTGKISANKQESNTSCENPTHPEVEESNTSAPEDSSVRKMIMEVIFGSDLKPLETENKDNEETENKDDEENKNKDNEESEYRDDEETKNKDEETENKDNEDTEITLESVIEEDRDLNKIDETSNHIDAQETAPTLTFKDSRPVRNRTATIKKDFLYDMTQLLKSKPTKPKGSIDFVRKQKPIKIYARNTKSSSTPQTKLVNNKSFNNNTNNKSITTNSNTS
ncbi:hypothetical protein RN001_006825 [Aquatica leii]|uniref:C2H2-type domain-containing protein n=1 Tax=Aquatica leii TaxID=1421715 RepID=A0AAN7PLJ1_9COLE|nr:hypothetical protein RN001_006825 [Aquatica leii]